MREFKNAVDMRLLNGDKEAFIEISTMDSINTDSIISQAFAFVGDSKHEKPEARKATAFETYAKPLKEKHDSAALFRTGNLKENESVIPLQKEEKIDKTDTSISRPKRLPLQSKGERTSYPVGELFEDKRERVQVFYHCPECHHSDQRTVPYGFRFVKCANCSQKLFLRPAGNTWGEKDEAGNTYVAEELYEADWE